MQLRERTVLIVGPFSTMTQQLMLLLSQEGADCVLVGPKNLIAEKYVLQLNDSREANEKNGRALFIHCDLNNADEIKDVVAKTIQSFGSIDIYVDAQLENQPTPMNIGGGIDQLNELIHRNLASALLFTNGVLPFLKNRKKGRIIYLINDSQSDLAIQDILASSLRSALKSFTQILAKQISEFNITVNSLNLTLTEEYILGHFPQSQSIIESVLKLKEKDPSLRITEPEKVAQAIIFLGGNSGGGISGQSIDIR